MRWLSTWRHAPRSGRVFEEVLSQHLDALYRTALRLCRGREADAEDLMQEVALRAFRRFGELRDVEAARSWLFTILVRTHLNRARATTRRAEVATDDLGEPDFERALEEWRTPGDRPDTVLDRARLMETLETALNALEPSLREVVCLVDIEGFRQREVATMLAVPEGTVASRLYRARRGLRELLLSDAAAGDRRRQEG